MSRKNKRWKYPDWVFDELEKNGISTNLFYSRMFRGLSIEEACKAGKLTRRRKGFNTLDYYYMLVTDDKYELPIGVYDNIHELAKAIGVKENTIYVNLCRNTKTLRGIGRLRKVKKIDC